MTSESSKPKKQELPKLDISKPKSIGTLNQFEAYDKFGTMRIDGLKVVGIETTTVTPNAHIVAFYK
jgi:hypothetical protein